MDGSPVSQWPVDEIANEVPLQAHDVAANDGTWPENTRRHSSYSSYSSGARPQESKLWCPNEQGKNISEHGPCWGGELQSNL